MIRMMIVDDEERIVNSLYGYLSDNFDLEIYRAYSGEEADELIHRMRFDLILSDISMPGLSGLDLLDRTKRLWPKCFFILLTAYNNFDFAYQALKYERVDYILKIEKPEVIRDTIQKKIELIEAERDTLPQTNLDLETLRVDMTRYLLKRIIIRGLPIPDEKDIAEMRLPLRLHSPVLVALEYFNVSLRDRDTLLSSSQDYLSQELSPYGLEIIHYRSSEHIIWLVQQRQESNGYTSRELVLFVQEAFGTLFQMLNEEWNSSVSLVCCDEFVPWNKLHELYRHALIRLDALDEGAMVTQSIPEGESQAPSPVSFPSLDDAYTLWDMLRHGQREAFLAKLADGLASLRGNTAPPSSSRAAIALLFSEARNLYGMYESEEIRRLSDIARETTGEAWVRDVLIAAEKLFEERDTSRQDTNTWLIRRIDDYMESHFPEDITLTSLAEMTHYNPSYLSRFYKQHTGKNLMSRLMEIRIEHAKHLLSQSSLKTSEIALNCGFCSTKYFNQAFKKATGHTPSEYREKP